MAIASLVEFDAEGKQFPNLKYAFWDIDFKKQKMEKISDLSPNYWKGI